MTRLIAAALFVVIVIALRQGAEWPRKLLFWYLAIIFSPYLLVTKGLPKLGVPEKHWSLVPLGIVLQTTVIFTWFYLAFN